MSKGRAGAERAVGCLYSGKELGRVQKPSGPGAACTRPALSHWRAARLPRLCTRATRHQFPEAALRAPGRWRSGPGAERRTPRAGRPGPWAEPPAPALGVCRVSATAFPSHSSPAPPLPLPPALYPVLAGPE